MYFAVIGTDKPGVAQERSDLQPSFIAYLRGHPDHPDVTVHNGGPMLAEDGESIVGLLLVVEAPSREAAEAFAMDSPFAKAELLADLQVRQWDWRTGRPG